MLHNKYAIGTVVGAALLGLAKSSFLGSKNDGVTVRSVKELRRYANNPYLAHLVTTVDLMHNQTNLPPEICNLNNLKSLFLSGNQLTTLPKEIGKLTNLEYLNLEFNELRTLPPEIGNLTKLETLDLAVNDLTTLPPEIGKLKNLKRLYLFRNDLKTLPPEIGNLTNLEELDLNRNPNFKITINFVVDLLNTYQNTDMAGKIRKYIHQQTIPARQTIRMR